MVPVPVSAVVAEVAERQQRVPAAAELLSPELCAFSFAVQSAPKRRRQPTTRQS